MKGVVSSEQHFWRELRRAFIQIRQAITDRPADSDSPLWAVVGRPLGIVIRAIEARHGK